VRLAAFLPVAFLAYGSGIESYWIAVTRHTFLPPAGVKLEAPLKIAHLTDLHTRGIGRRERILLAILDAENPDVIVVTGDTVSTTDKETRPLLSALRAPLGVYVVRGNWENWSAMGNERAHYALTGARLLLNEGGPLRPDAWLAGVDDLTGAPDMDAALAGAPANALRIALFHSPAYFDSVAGKLHLALAGHSHGGQVRIPFLPPLWVPRGVGRYVEGWYELGSARMYVSRGVGTSILPIRFACRPEVAIITVTGGQ
jgi:hypothetical protein